MCGRFGVRDLAALEQIYGRRFRFEEFSEARLPRVRRYNVAPTQPVLAVKAGSIAVEPMIWGAHGRINTRAESLSGRRVQRCGIFADAFYEWSSGQPYRYTLDDDAPFLFAGLWSRPGPHEDEASCTIVTCEPNDLVSAVHNRMPVVLPPDALDLWISGDDVPPDVMRALLVPYPAEKMTVRPVSRRLNNARYDAPDVLDEDRGPVQQSLGL